MLTATKVVATIPATDLERAKEFYGGTLGLKQLTDSPAAILFQCGEASEVSVFKRPPITTEHTLAHFEVDDIEAAVQDLEAKGVDFIDYDEGPLRTEGHIARNGPFRGAWFHDPDGNTLGLRQM